MSRSLEIRGFERIDWSVCLSVCLSGRQELFEWGGVVVMLGFMMLSVSIILVVLLILLVSFHDTGCFQDIDCLHILTNSR